MLLLFTLYGMAKFVVRYRRATERDHTCSSFIADSLEWATFIMLGSHFLGRFQGRKSDWTDIARVLTLAFAWATKSTLENFAAGLILVSSQHYRIGEWIVVDKTCDGLVRGPSPCFLTEMLLAVCFMHEMLPGVCC